MGKLKMVKLKDVIISSRSGVSRKLSTEDIGYYVVRSGNIQNGKFIKDPQKFWHTIDNQGTDLTKYILEEGDILVNFINSLAQIGKTAIFKDIGRDCIFTTNIFQLKLKDNLLDKYFLYYSMSEDYYKFISSITKPAVNQASFTRKNFGELPIPLPPLPEQQRIVTKLDGLFAKIDQAMALLEENILHTKALMGSVLDEELSGLNYDSSKWKSKKWKDVLDVKNGKNQKAVLNPNGKYPIYGSGGIMNYADDYLCNEDSVIIGRKGTINKPIYVETKFWNVDTAFGLESKENLLPRFLYFFCIHFNFMSLNKSTTLPSLAKRDLLEIEINLPPLETQKKILLKLEIVDKFKDDIIKSQTQKLNHLKALKSSLLDQAFKGEL